MEVLSQSEIDKLLEALASGDLEVSDDSKTGSKKIKKYDFRKPNKFGKEQMRTLHVIYEYFARLLATYLSGVLRTNCHVEIGSVEEQIFLEFVNSLPESVILAIIDMPPLKGSILMEVSATVAYGIIDRILGGVGEEFKEDRDYTEIEISLLEQIVSHITELFRDAWSNVVQVDPVLERIETNSRFIHILSSNESMAIITLEVEIGDLKGLINVCIPNFSIKPIAEKLNSKLWYSYDRPETGEKFQADDIMDSLKKSSVDVSAILGKSSITAKEIMELRPGDVIQLSSRIDEPIKLCIGDIVKYYAVPGMQNNKIAVKILSKADEEAENE